MTEYAQVLFVNGKATPLFLARWRAKGALEPIPAALTLTADALATNDFRALWKRAFPLRTPLPHEPLHRPDGVITKAFHRVWH